MNDAAPAKNAGLAGTAIGSAVGAASSWVATTALSTVAPALGGATSIACAAVGLLAGGLGYWTGFRRGLSHRGPVRTSAWAKRRLVAGMPRGEARAILAAFRAVGPISPGKHAQVVEMSLRMNEGVFLAEAYGYGGPQVMGDFTITPDWRMFLSKERNLAHLERAAKAA